MLTIALVALTACGGSSSSDRPAGADSTTGVADQTTTSADTTPAAAATVRASTSTGDAATLTYSFPDLAGPAADSEVASQVETACHVDVARAVVRKLEVSVDSTSSQPASVELDLGLSIVFSQEAQFLVEYTGQGWQCTPVLGEMKISTTSDVSARGSWSASAWYVVPNAITPNSPNGDTARIVVQPQVTLAGELAALDGSGSAWWRCTDDVGGIKGYLVISGQLDDASCSQVDGGAGDSTTTGDSSPSNPDLKVSPATLGPVHITAPRAWWYGKIGSEAPAIPSGLNDSCATDVWANDLASLAKAGTPQTTAKYYAFDTSDSMCTGLSVLTLDTAITSDFDRQARYTYTGSSGPVSVAALPTAGPHAYRQKYADSSGFSVEMVLVFGKSQTVFISLNARKARDLAPLEASLRVDA